MTTEEERAGDTNEQKATTREAVPLLAVLAKRPAAMPQSADSDLAIDALKDKIPDISKRIAGNLEQPPEGEGDRVK